MNFEQTIVLGYQEYNFKKELIELKRWILRDQNVEFGQTRLGKCAFLICLLEDFTFLQGWLDSLEKLLSSGTPKWSHNVRVSIFPERDRLHWLVPDSLLHFLARHHLRLIISFTGWGDDKSGRSNGRILRDITYQAEQRKVLVPIIQECRSKLIEHITLYTSDDMDSFSISPRKLRKCLQKEASLIISIRRLS